MKDLIERQAAIDAVDKLSDKPIGYLEAAIDVLVDLPPVQPELCEDAVSRQRLLSDLKELIAAWEKYPVMAEQIKGVETAIKYVETIPSVQPEKRTIKHTETHACDCISRHGAIDIANDLRACISVDGYWAWIERLKKLPPVQPDIIHCKDCKYWMPYDWMFSEVWQSQNMDDYPEKEIGCQYCDMNMSANDFCSRSERRADEA